MKLATSTSDFFDYTNNQLDACLYLKESGFRYLDYSFIQDYQLRNGIYQENWRDYCNDLANVVSAMGIKFVQGHAPMGGPIAPGNDAFVEDTIRCIEACDLLGIPNLVVHSGYSKGLSKAETFAQNRDFFLKLLQVAGQYNINILVENFNKMCVEGIYWMDNATDLLAFIEYVDHPLLHALWDAGHGNLQDMPQHEELMILGRHVYGLHIHDNEGWEDKHQMPYTGNLNFDSLLYGLQKIGYQGYYTFETGVILPEFRRRAFEGDSRLRKAPLSLKIEAEKLLYQIGKCTLEAYGLYEE